MNLDSKKYIVLFLFAVIITFSITAQNTEELWLRSSEIENSSFRKLGRKSMPNKFDIFQLQKNKFNNLLQKTPTRKKREISNSSIVMSFPTKEGKLENFQIFEASIMNEELQKKYPNIKSYIGRSLENPTTLIRLSNTYLGLHGMIMQKSGETIYIDPYTTGNESYIVYSKKNLPVLENFVCKTDELITTSGVDKSNLSSRVDVAGDGNLRTFRLAVATTGEYSQYHLVDRGISSSASVAEKKAAVLSAIIVTMTRVNGIFERDLSLTMELVANNDELIFLDPDTDNFTNNDGSILIDESQTVIDSVIGFANYDIGHTFSTGGGGLAQIGSPCTIGKARGITGSSNPVGDAYDIDYVAHEMGHQYGAHHTFNSDAGNCGGGNRSDAFAVEPGSGSTIMAYAGLCAPENVQAQSDSYFHIVSINEMWANISVGNSTCATTSSTGNNAPVLEDLSNHTIPVSTPFVLDVNASDVDSDNLTYTWEQLDTEIAPYPLISTATGGPAFRSVSPSESSKRYFPDISTVVAGNLSNDWEVLPSVSRTMNFAVNVRDNNVNGGLTSSKELVVTFDENSGPFKVTSQNVSETWDAGTAKTITWDVANTNVSPINCSFVNILFSTDGGKTFPITLASNVANDGTHEIVVPNNTTSKGRVIVESVGNVFYAMNTADINVQASEFIMNFDADSKNICAPNNIVYTFTYNTFLGFNEETTFSASGNPAGTTITFNPTSATADNTVVEMTISGIADSMVGNYNISVTGTSSSNSKETVVGLGIYSSSINAPTLNLPSDNAVGVLKPYELNWIVDDNGLNYSIEIATDNTFNSIVESSVVNSNFYIPQLLQTNTTYYWRVKTINDCGESAYSTIFSFTTENEVCNTNASSDTPLSIPDNSSVGVSSVINITDNKTITDVNVTVNITHTWIEDLALTLTSPTGTTILLASGIGGDGDNYTNTVFDSDETTEIIYGIPPFTGTFSPQGNLSNLNGEESYGEWVLKVVDSQEQDVGQIDGWSIEICGTPVNSNDDDKDGVTNDIDQCPNTPLGTTVDATGCPMFSLPSDNFNIEVISETCPNKNNGLITISATENLNYTAFINGNTYGFTQNLTIENLSPGKYDLCITVQGENYEQCFEVEIFAGTAVSAKASVKSSKMAIEIVEGTAPYKVYINNAQIIETQTKNIVVDVKHGDLVEVKTKVDCEGVFSKTVELFDEVVAYPNPTKGLFEVALPINEKEVVAEIYTIQGQLISSNLYTVRYGKIHLDLTNKPTGIYIVKLRLKVPISVKVIKQ